MPADPALARRTSGTDAAAVVVASLRRRGARHVFGMPGEALNALIEAMRVDGQLTMVSVRHEGYGSIMASSYAKVRGSIGVCVGASGPGTTHLALGVADAWADGVPLVALSGQVPLALVGKDVFQEIDSPTLFRKATVSSRMIATPDQLHLVDRACVEALTHRRPVHVSLPTDLLRERVGDIPALPMVPLAGTNGRAAPAPRERDRPVPPLWAVIDACWPPDGILSLGPGRALDGASRFLARSRRVTASHGVAIGGYAIPGAIGAAFADPASPVLAVTELDGFAESMVELTTIARHRLPICTICIGSDGTPVDVLAAARACGVAARRVADTGALAVALAEAAASGEPTVVVVPGALAGPPIEDVAMPAEAARALADALQRAGVRRAYGTSRPTVQPLVDALAATDVGFVGVTHPESAAMMASAVSKTFGEPAACIASTTSDAILQLNGLYDAAFDGAAVLLVMPPATVAALDELGFLDALQLDRAGGADGGATFGRIGPTARRAAVLPPAEVVRAAANRLLAARRVVIVAGRGALGARAELTALAELLPAPVVTTMPGRGSIAADHPCHIGGIGSSGHVAAADALADADLVLVLGRSNRATLFGEDRPRDTIQVDLDAARLATSPVTMPIVGDVQATLAALLARLTEAHEDRHDDRRRFAERWRTAHERWRGLAEGAASSSGRPIRPSAIGHVVDAALARQPTPATITVDVGVVTLWVYRHVLGEHRFVWSSSFGTMGFAVPAAIAVAERSPGSAVLAAVGDGGIGITLPELATAGRLGVPVIVVVFDNGKLAAVKFEQEVMGWPEFESALQNPDFPAIAAACGMAGVRVDRASALAAELDRALRSGTSTLIDVVCDPDELPTPPRLRTRQGIGYTLARAREIRRAAGG